MCRWLDKHTNLRNIIFLLLYHYVPKALDEIEIADPNSSIFALILLTLTTCLCLFHYLLFPFSDNHFPWCYLQEPWIVRWRRAWWCVNAGVLLSVGETEVAGELEDRGRRGVWWENQGLVSCLSQQQWEHG